MNRGSPERISFFLSPSLSLSLFLGLALQSATIIEIINKPSDLSVSCWAVCAAAAVAQNAHLSECFQRRGQRNFVVYTLGNHVTPSPLSHPRLQAVLTSLPLIRMLVWRWNSESRLAPVMNERKWHEWNNTFPQWGKGNSADLAGAQSFSFTNVKTQARSFATLPYFILSTKKKRKKESATFSIRAMVTCP